MKYSIEGAPLPVVICDLEAGESMITEKGAMSWMTPNMKMETSGGGMGKMIGRMFSGENMFQNRYTAEGGAGQIAYASSFPGSILAFEIGNGNEIIAQKSAFLASTDGVTLSVAFQKKLGGGLFGGEGFIMQRLSGNGTAFVEIDGYVKDWVFQEMKQGKMWHWTRDSLPACKECLYKYLCPSPSNYELVIGKPNLCHVKPWKC